MSANNSSHFVGRLAAAPTIFDPNADGSHKVAMTIYTDLDYADRSGKTASAKVPMEIYIPANKDNRLETYRSRLTQGSLVSVEAEIAQESYQKNGETVYETKVKMRNDPNFLESNATTDARKLSADAAQAAPQAPQAPAAPVQGQVQPNPAAAANQTAQGFPANADQPAFG